jgi:hypothetical protein
MTAARATAGWPWRIASTRSDETFSPPDFHDVLHPDLHDAVAVVVVGADVAAVEPAAAQGFGGGGGVLVVAGGDGRLVRLAVRHALVRRIDEGAGAADQRLVVRPAPGVALEEVAGADPLPAIVRAPLEEVFDVDHDVEASSRQNTSLRVILPWTDRPANRRCPGRCRSAA